ncbi:MAG: hypothetical protein FWF78_09780 [Defluviitaleaceae bacterium]|nr:hypothetical protein [Defluviitaleaceae bacterium]
MIEMQVSSAYIANHYGKKIFRWIIDNESWLHTMGTNLFIKYITEEFGALTEIAKNANIPT